MFNTTVQWHWVRPLLLGASAALIFGCTCLAKKPIHSAEDVFGTWTGLTDDQSYVCRLDLLPEGRGAFALQFHDKAIRLYRIASWGVHDERISLTLQPVRPFPGSFQIALHIHLHDRIDATIAGEYNSSKWKRNVRLVRDSYMKSRVESLESALNQLK